MTMTTTNSEPHATLEEQPQLHPGTTCRQCSRGLDMTHGAGYWRGEWYCLPCLLTGRRR